MGFPKHLLVDDEQLVLSMRPHAIVLVPPALVALVVVAAWIVILPNLPDGSTGSTTRWVLLGAGVVLLLWYPARAFLTWWFSYFVVTSDRVIHRQGIIGKYSMEIPLEAINDVRFNQSVWARLIGSGDLIIQSASETGRQAFSDIWHPERVQRTIYEQGELNQQRMYQGVSRASQRGGDGDGESSVDALERLAALRERGALTDAEFEAEKRRLLG
jgi:uncharacterized membrane protein YdbT with pleckstrin-like domain